MPAMRRLPALLLLVLPMLAVGPATAPADAAARPGWHDVLRFDEQLTTADVRCCLVNYSPKRFVGCSRGILDAFTFPQARGDAHLVRRESDDSLIPEGLARGRMCVRWTVDLQQADALSGRRAGVIRRVGRDLVIKPGAILLRPYMWPLAGRVTVTIEAPPSVRHLVPWPRTHQENTYLLDPQCTNLEGRIAVGRFDVMRDRVAGADVDIAVLDRPLRATPAGIRTWIHTAVDAVAGLFGRFPSDQLAVMVQPAPGREPPVYFGMAMRAGGAHAILYPTNAAPDERLPGEWVAVHELMHLGMPWTPDDEPWLQEGFVTYYQEVLRARAGIFDERQAWQNIEEGFVRGRRRGGRRPLVEESRTMGREHNYHRVYWAGAAMALRIDVALRAASGGRVSLDDVIRWWLAHRGGTVRPYPGLALLRDAERALGVPKASPIAEALLADRAFPDMRATYAALGIRVQDGRVALDDEAPQAALRRAIMAPRRVPAAGGRGVR